MRRMRVSWRLATAIALIAGSSIPVQVCGQAPGLESSADAVEPAFQVRDSAGVEIATTGPSALEAYLGWSVDPEADVRLGALGGDVEFYRVRGVTASSDGGIVVVEGEAAQVRYFNDAGDLVARIGGRGQGPEEFMFPQLIPRGSGDPLQVFDGQLRRFVTLDSTGGVLELVRKPGLIGGRPMGRAGDWVLVAQQMMVPPRLGVHEYDLTFFWEHLGSDESLEIAAMKSHQTWVTEIAGQLSVLELPFSPRPVSAVHGDRALVTRGQAHRIEVYDLEGRLERILEVDAARTPVTAARLDAYFDYAASRGTLAASEHAARYASAPIPDSLPAFSSLIADAAGQLWAQLYTIDRRASSPWVVFDADGRARGRVMMPPGLEVHEIGEDYVLGIVTDEWGIQVVQRHRLARH